MGKLVLIMILFISGLSYNQTLTNVGNGGRIITDSLYYGTPGDSVTIYNFETDYTSLRIIIKGNANATADTIAIREGTIRYDNNNNPIDTIWGSLVALKDSAFNTTNFVINNTLGKSFSLYTLPVGTLYKFYLTNYRATVPTRKVHYAIIGRKERK